LGGVAQLIFILWAAGREELWLRLAWPRWTAEIKEFFIAFGAVTFGAASIVISPFIDTILASYLPVGSRTALYYADRINQLPLGVLGIALGTVLLPEMSARLARGDSAGSAAAQNRSAATSLLLTLPFAAVFLAIPGTIMRAVFVHGAFNTGAAGLAALALAAYGVGLPAMAMLRIVQATFYARHDTITPARATVIAIVSNIALKAIFVWGLHLGVAGLALGTALGAWINVALLTWLGHSRALLGIEKMFVRSLPPVLIAAIATGLAAWAGAWTAAPLLPGRFSDTAGLAGAMALGFIAYSAVVLIFRRALPLGKFSQ
jgi:putative peptidoglycan lipid II flippase